MQKSILSILFIITISFQVQSQWFTSAVKGNGVLVNKTRKVSNYDKILVTGAFDVALVKGKEGSLKIKIEENLLEYLITEVKDNRLVIKWKNNTNIRTRKGIHIVVPFEDINSVTLTGSGDIIASDVIESKSFSTKLSGSGDIVLNLKSNTIKTRVTGSGNIELLGETDDLEVLVTGSGGFNSKNLKATDVTAKLTGSGDIDIYVSHDLNARVTGSGDITYTGNPEFLNTKTTGSGDIEAK